MDKQRMDLDQSGASSSQDNYHIPQRNAIESKRGSIYDQIEEVVNSSSR